VASNSPGRHLPNTYASLRDGILPSSASRAILIGTVCPMAHTRNPLGRGWVYSGGVACKRADGSSGPARGRWPGQKACLSNQCRPLLIESDRKGHSATRRASGRVRVGGLSFSKGGTSSCEVHEAWLRLTRAVATVSCLRQSVDFLQRAVRCDITLAARKGTLAKDAKGSIFRKWVR